MFGSVQPAAATPSSPPAAAASIVAQASERVVNVYRSPHATRPFLRLKNPTVYGAPLVFLVIARKPGWERVSLPIRPNESSGWVRDRAVTLALNPYRVDVSLSAHRITVRKAGRVVLADAAGVGRSVLPTPSGTYFIVDLLEQPNPRGPYGPYAFGLSAFSNVLFSFGGGPGQIGLHGTDDPSTLGTSVSHGCIRVSNASISRLASFLPLGTPVHIAD